jgi:hypothetical protein
MKAVNMVVLGKNLYETIYTLPDALQKRLRAATPVCDPDDGAMAGA